MSTPGRIFVVGAPRSGTTLVQSLVAAHPRVAAFTESHFFNRHFTMLPGGGAVLKRHPAARVAEFLHENGLPASLVPDWTAAWLRPLRTAQALVGVLDAAARLRDHPHWVEKTPRHLHYLPLIARVAPNARVVHVLRRREDVVRSLAQASASWGRPLSPYACARRWASDVRITLGHVHISGHCVIAYEDLVTDPGGTTARMFAALGLPPDDGAIDRHAEAAAPLIVAREHWKVAALGSIIRSSGAADVPESALDPLYLRAREAAL